MEIRFEADRVSVETIYMNSNVVVTVDANPRDIAEKLDMDDRLHDLDASDVVEEIGHIECLEAIGEEEVREWLLKNSDHDDLLKYIGLDKIHDFLSHQE